MLHKIQICMALSLCLCTNMWAWFL